MKIKAIQTKILVDPVKIEIKTKSGIILSNDDDIIVEQYATGVVINKGDSSSCEIEIGDTVMFPSGAGIVVNHDTKECLLMEGYDIIAVVYP